MRDELFHYGTPRHSGRYPWGSGENPHQRTMNFLAQYTELHAKGLSEKEIASEMKMTVTELRNRKSTARKEDRAALINRAVRLKNHGYSNGKIAEILGVAGESTVRIYLKDAEKVKEDAAVNTANVLKKAVAEKGFIDIGKNVEIELGVTRTKFNVAIQQLKDKGYVEKSVSIEQVTNPGKYTTVKVLAPPNTDEKDIINAVHTGQVKSINAYSPDKGETFNNIQFPTSISSKRVAIKYAEDGGKDMDGVIEIRRNVKDLSLGNSSYAQVRIAVDGTHYLKGMAIYADDLPAGTDIRFNTNKNSSVPKMDVLKKLKIDKETGKVDVDNPFGALIKANGQNWYEDTDGTKKLGAINKLKEEGDWDHYSKSLSAQFLSKQPLSLITKQLNLASSEKKSEFDDIMSLTNPTIKKRLLIEFADNCDKAAEDLKAAALPRQSSKVILPVSSLKDNEVYAPSYKDGETVCLVRFPHAGTFEIPELVVNNRNKQGKEIVGSKAIDAIGINSKVAAKLSGADFDGDSVVVIPTNKNVNIKTSRSLKELENFDPSEAYPKYEGMKVINSRTKQIQMGIVSNLITDMTLQGASPNELARAVKHSMVVIDAEKHELNYKLSEEENGISALKKKYQGKSTGGAATLISKAGGEIDVPQRKKTNSGDSKYIDSETGKKIVEETGKGYTKTTVNKKTGEVTEKFVKLTEKASRMSLVDDARTLMSGPNHEGTKQERAYAQYANTMKSLANTARKESLSTGKLEYNPTAKKTYAAEVNSLKAKLNNALKNAPKERQAQMIAEAKVNQKKGANPNMENEELQKLKQNSLAIARASVGASKKNVQVQITDREWEAIQAGAISDALLSRILDNTDSDKIKERAMPKQTTTLSSAKVSRIKNMASSGYTIAEIAEQLGVSTTTINKYIK